MGPRMPEQKTAGLRQQLQRGLRGAEAEQGLRARDNERARQILRDHPGLAAAFLREFFDLASGLPRTDIRRGLAVPALDNQVGWGLGARLLELLVGEGFIRWDGPDIGYSLTRHGRVLALDVPVVPLASVVLAVSAPRREIAGRVVGSGYAALHAAPICFEPGTWEAWFDGAAAPTNPGECSIGFVLKSPDGQVLRYGEATGFGTNNEAEYAACEAAVERLLALGAKEAVVYGDSKLVINQVNGDWARRAPVLQRYCSAVRKLARSIKLRFVWIPREENQEADALTQEALSPVLGRAWEGNTSDYGRLTDVGLLLQPVVSAVNVGKMLDKLGLRHGRLPTGSAVDQGLGRVYETRYGLKADWHLKKVAALLGITPKPALY